MTLGFREILLILVVLIVVLYSRSFHLVGIKKSLGLEPTTPEDEVRVGASWLSDMAKEQSIKPEEGSRVQTILDNFRATGRLTFKSYKVFRMDSPEINALALPGGHILLTQGLMTLPDTSEDQLAGILAHEIAHVELGHCRKALIRKNRTEALQLFLSLANRRPGTASSIVEHLAKLGISRESELEADDFAFQLLLKSCYAPIGLVQFLERAKQKERIPEWLTFLSTHPGNNERIGRLRQQIKTQ
jgi:predicted Zn-dependent protease